MIERIWSVTLGVCFYPRNARQWPYGLLRWVETPQKEQILTFAQGMLQTPSVSNPNGEYKALGLNMAYERPNDGSQWYNIIRRSSITWWDWSFYMKDL